ncbi:MAG: hypothetical protein HYT08_04970 [Candidatus Levybacteria bacterium]|nr:hypothetical protein [Candidatus Levybacteria bacterium]
MKVETLGQIGFRINTINETNAVRINPKIFKIPTLREIVRSFVFSNDPVRISIIKSGEAKRIRRRHLDIMKTLKKDERWNLLNQIAIRMEAADSVLIESMDPWKYF